MKTRYTILGGLMASALVAGPAAAQFLGEPASPFHANPEAPLEAPLAEAVPGEIGGVEIRTLPPVTALQLKSDGDGIGQIEAAQSAVLAEPGLVDQLQAQGISLLDVVDVAIGPAGNVTTVYVAG